MGLLNKIEDKLTGHHKTEGHNTQPDSHTTSQHVGQPTHHTGVTDSAIHPQHHSHTGHTTSTTGQHLPGQSSTGQHIGVTGHTNQPLHGEHNAQHDVGTNVAQHELNKHQGTSHLGTGAPGNYDSATAHAGHQQHNDLGHTQSGHHSTINPAHNSHTGQTGVAGVAQHEMNKHTQPHAEQNLGRGDSHLHGGTTATTTTNTNTSTNHNAHGLGGQPHSLTHNNVHSGAGSTGVAGAAASAAGAATGQHGTHHHDTQHSSHHHGGQQNAHGFHANAENPAAIPTAGGVKVGAGANGEYASSNVGSGVNTGSHGARHSGVSHQQQHGSGLGDHHHNGTHGVTSGVGHHDHAHGVSSSVGHDGHSHGVNSGVGQAVPHHSHNQLGSAVNPADSAGHNAGHGGAVDAQGIPIERKVGSAYEAGYRDATSHAQPQH